MSFENSAGLSVRNHYGPRSIDEKFGGEVTTAGNLKEVEWVFSYDDLPAAVATLDMEAMIPAKAYIRNAYLEVLTAMAGSVGTLTLGLEEQDGTTAIDADGIDVAVAQAVLIANAVIACDGALVGGATNIGNSNGYLVATTGGTVTAGKFRLVVEYEDGHADGSGNYTAGGTKG